MGYQPVNDSGVGGGKVSLLNGDGRLKGRRRKSQSRTRSRCFAAERGRGEVGVGEGVGKRRGQLFGLEAYLRR
jgi:hypothetical protein